MLSPSRSTTFSPGGGHIKERVHNVVLQQIHLVDIEKAAIGLREQAGLKGFFASYRVRAQCPMRTTTRSSVEPSGRSTTGMVTALASGVSEGLPHCAQSPGRGAVGITLV